MERGATVDEMTLPFMERAHQWGLAALVTYGIIELLWLRRRGGPPAREARMTILGTMSEGALMGLVTVLWRPVSLGAAASYGASLSPWSGGLGVEAWVIGYQSEAASVAFPFA